MNFGRWKDPAHQQRVITSQLQEMEDTIFEGVEGSDIKKTVQLMKMSSFSAFVLIRDSNLGSQTFPIAHNCARFDGAGAMGKA